MAAATPSIIHALILAAGASSRMRGRDKLLEPVGGIPALRRCAERALASNVDAVAVVVGPNQDTRRNALAGLDVAIIESKESVQGLSRSIRSGLAAAPPETAALMILLPDMPEIETDDMNAVIAGRGTADVVRAATADGRPGHPVLIARELFPRLARLGGDQGLRSVIRPNQDRVRLIPRPGERALLDLDTPDEWAAWRRQTANR